MINKNNKRAETLFEVTIAVAILSLVLISAIKIHANAKLSIETARDRAQAVSLARE
jgi:hypothetical protein